MYYAVSFFIFACFVNVLVCKTRDKLYSDYFIESPPLPDCILDNIPQINCPMTYAYLNTLQDVLAIVPLIGYLYIGAPNGRRVFLLGGFAYVIRALSLATTCMPSPGPKHHSISNYKETYTSRSDVTVSGHTIMALTFTLGIWKYGNSPRLAKIASTAWFSHEVLKLLLRCHYSSDIIMAIGLCVAPYL